MYTFRVLTDMIHISRRSFSGTHMFWDIAILRKRAFLLGPGAWRLFTTIYPNLQHIHIPLNKTFNWLPNQWSISDSHMLYQYSIHHWSIVSEKNHSQCLHQRIAKWIKMDHYLKSRTTSRCVVKFYQCVHTIYILMSRLRSCIID